MGSLYDLSVPMLTRGLKSLDSTLTKGEAHAKANNVALTEYLQASLAPDMKDLVFQVQTACNAAKFVVVRVGGIENVVVEDNEKTFEELHARIASTIQFIEKVDRKHFEGKENAEIVVMEMKLTSTTYLTNFAFPNFFFHCVTAYDILRSKGVPIGKQDFLNI